MNSVRKVFGFVMVLVLAAFAFPASAAAPPTKQYGLDITSSPPPAYPGTGGGSAVGLPVSGGTVYWTISNQTASGGNSAIGSFVIKKAPGVKITNPAGPPGIVFDLVTLAATGDLKVSGVGPLVPKQDSGTHQVTINFTLTSEDQCLGATTPWAPTKVVVTTGTFSSTTFAFTLSNSLSLLTNQSTSIASTTCYAVTGLGNPLAGGTVACSPALVPSGSSSTCTATATTTPIRYFLTGFSDSPIACVRIGTTNQCTVSNVTHDTTTTGLFALSNGQVGCLRVDPTTTTLDASNNYDSSLGKSDHQYDPDFSNVPFFAGWGLRRGANYADSICQLVDVAVTPPNASSSIASILFDQTTGQQASWKYLFVWPTSVLLDSTGWTTFRPWVSWGIPTPDPTPTAADYVPGLFCLDEVASVDITYPGKTTAEAATALQALLPTLPDDTSTNGPFYKASQAHPTVYVLGGKAKVCVARSGVLSDGGVLFPFAEFLDEADTFISPR